MTREETLEKIDSLRYLIGQNVPKWNSPILEMIPAPISGKFVEYIKIYRKTMDFKKAMLLIPSGKFDILLIFRTPALHGELVYEWYSFFYKQD